MTDAPKNARLADEPLEVRREAQIVRQREIKEGLDRQLLAMADEHRFRTAVALGRVPDLATKLRGD